MTSNGQIGSGPYSGGQGVRRPTPKSICEMLMRKSQLRAELQMEAQRIQEALPNLNAIELDELRALVAVEIETIDDDVRRDIEQETALARSTRAMEIKLDRVTSQALQQEMLRRLESGSFCPPPATLIREALTLAFKEARHV